MAIDRDASLVFWGFAGVVISWVIIGTLLGFVVLGVIAPPGLTLQPWLLQSISNACAAICALGFMAYMTRRTSRRTAHRTFLMESTWALLLAIGVSVAFGFALESMVNGVPTPSDKTLAGVALRALFLSTALAPALIVRVRKKTRRHGDMALLESKQADHLVRSEIFDRLHGDVQGSLTAVRLMIHELGGPEDSTRKARIDALLQQLCDEVLRERINKLHHHDDYRPLEQQLHQIASTFHVPSPVCFETGRYGQFGRDREFERGMCLLLTEALTNAAKHGSSGVASCAWTWREPAAGEFAHWSLEVSNPLAPNSQPRADTNLWALDSYARLTGATVTHDLADDHWRIRVAGYKDLRTAPGLR